MSRVTLNQMYSYKLYTFFLLAMTPPPLQQLFSMAKLKINDIQYRVFNTMRKTMGKPVCQCALFFVDFG